MSGERYPVCLHSILLTNIWNYNKINYWNLLHRMGDFSSMYFSDWIAKILLVHLKSHFLLLLIKATPSTMSVANWNGSTNAFSGLIEVTLKIYEKYIGTSGRLVTAPLFKSVVKIIINTRETIGWIRGQVIVKNIGQVPLLDVSVRVDIEDNGNCWDGVFVCFLLSSLIILLPFSNFCLIVLFDRWPVLVEPSKPLKLFLLERYQSEHQRTNCSGTPSSLPSVTSSLQRHSPSLQR